MKQKEMQKIGYVLSGGGARGFAHLGVIKLLEETGIKPFAISGTSVGAVIGGLYAAGKNSEEILDILKNNKFFSWSNLSVLKKGFFSMDVLKKILKDNIVKNDFNALQTKLFVTATDLIKGESVILSEGDLFGSIVASASIPVVFEPVSYGDRLFVDGGVLNNFPVEPLEKNCDVIIGSHVNKIENGFQEKHFFKTVEILDRCFHLAISNTVYSNKNKCDVFIDIPLQHYNTYDVKNADKIFEIGYNTALQYKKELIKFVNN